MTEYFTQKDYLDVKAQRKKTLIIFYSVLAVFAIATIGLFVWYRTLPYKSPSISTIKIIQHLLSVAFVIFAFLYLGIVFKRVNKFYKVAKNLMEGLKETNEASFFEYKDAVTIKDGVEFKALVFIEWNKYKKDYFERNVLVFNEREFPVIPEKAIVEFVTQGNVLIKYKIIEEPQEEIEQGE